MELSNKIIEGYKQEFNILMNAIQNCNNIPTRDKLQKQLEKTENILNYFDKERL